jgi:hypothetical protein
MPPRLTAGQGNAIGAAIRNFRRAKNQWNNSSKKLSNSHLTLGNTGNKLRRNNPTTLMIAPGGLFGFGQGHNVYRPMYNAIRALPTRTPNGKPIAKSNNMKYYLTLYNNHQRLVRNTVRNAQAFRTAARHVVRTSTNPAQIALLNNIARANVGGNERLESLAMRVIRAHELEKGRMIRNIVKERMASPRTAIGKRLIMGRMPKNSYK